MLTAAMRQDETWLNEIVWFIVALWQLHKGQVRVLRGAPDWVVAAFAEGLWDVPCEHERLFELLGEAEAEQRARRRSK